MTTIIPIGDYLAVTVPEHPQFKPAVYGYDNEYWIVYMGREDGVNKVKTSEHLPEGNWQILGRLNELSEQERIDFMQAGLLGKAWETPESALILKKQ